MATPRKKYPRRFPRLATYNPPASAGNPDAAQAYEKNYQDSVWRDLWELFKRVWALENSVSGPGGSVTNITSTDNSVTITTTDNTVNISVTNAGGGGNGLFWALVLGG